ncbi:MAG: GNAT family N-acetyltransferase [Alphaproteobacteria bacterium]|nr:GNAT family N-acetyltransferase [Alphaproteobacteria bacterium]
MQKIILGKNINLRLALESDAEFILALRKAKGQYLSKTDITVSQQKLWIADYKKRETAQEEFYFIIESKLAELLGTIRLYDFKNGSFCWGSWAIKDGAPRTTAIESVILVYDIGFYKLGFNHCHFDVRKDNKKLVRFHESFGARRTHENDLDYFYSFTKHDFLISRAKFKSYTTD